MPSPSRTFPIVLVCFLLSGVAALLYQTVWMRYFSILFGTSELAVVTVLMAYMAGLALGAALIGRVVDRLLRPVRVYALLEIGIAISAALVPTALHLVRSLRIALLGGQAELPSSMGFGQGFFYLAAGFLILMIPTVFMGATLPLLAKGVVHTREDIGKRIGLLYSINTLGAIIGTLAAAFILIPALGLRLTAATGIALNILAGLLGLAAARQIQSAKTPPEPTTCHPERAPRVEGPPKQSKSPASAPDPQPPKTPFNPQDKVQSGRPAATQRSSPSLRRTTILLPLMLLSGALSFSYEVLWTRLLGIVVGGSLTAFATMLAGFLLGITLGSAIASRLARNAAVSIRGLVLAQVGTALLSVAVYYLLSFIPDWTSHVRLSGWSTSSWTALCSILLLLPSTICIGATFPFAVRILSTDPADAAPAAARVYSWNTLGAILGAFLAGFYLIPALGFSGMIALAATGNLLLALTASLLVEKKRRPILIAGALAVLGVALFFRPGVPIEILRATRFEARQSSEQTSRMLFYDVGRSATVVALENQGRYFLRTNGLPEATIRLPGSVIYPKDESQLMGILPCLANLSADSMLVIGLGGGKVITTVPPQIKAIDVVELEEAVVDANRKMAPGRFRDPLSDPRVHVVVNDARGALALSDKKYDIIVSQPSHPWTAGASHLYTREFLQEAAARLNPNGVFLQWVGTAFVDESLARSLLSTVTAVFPSVRVHLIENNLLILGSVGEFTSFEELYASAGENGSILQYTNWPALRYAEDAAATLLLDENTVRKFCEGAPPSTDDHNLMAIQSPRLIDYPERTLRAADYQFWRSYDAYLNGNLLSSLAAIPGWSNPRLLWKMNVLGASDRCNALLDTLTDPEEAAFTRGLIALTEEDFPTCIREFGTALESNSNNRAALFYYTYSLFRVMPNMVGRTELFIDSAQSPPRSAVEEKFFQLAPSLSANERLILEALFYAATAQWQKVRAADALLEEAVGPRNLLFGLVSVQRSRALLEGADPSWSTTERVHAARTALGYINRALDNSFYNETLFALRGEAAAIAGHEAEFIDTVWYFVRQSLNTPAEDSDERLARLNTANALIANHVSSNPAERSPNIQKLIDELTVAVRLTVENSKNVPQN